MTYVSDEPVAVEYLLAQSGQGDPGFYLHVDEEGSILPELNQEEAAEEEIMDATACLEGTVKQVKFMAGTFHDFFKYIPFH